MRPLPMRPLPTFAPILCLFALGACADGGTGPDDGAPEPAEPVVLGGVDLNQPLRALGTEPFWAVSIDASGLAYSGVDRPEQRAANPGPQVQGSAAQWNVRTDQDQPLIVTLIDTECSDGMSDRTYPLTARVEIGEETLNGCAASVEFLETTDEQGRPRA